LKVITQELEPDVILLTETWCNDSVSNASLSLENYKLETELRKDRCDTANGVGVDYSSTPKTIYRFYPVIPQTIISISSAHLALRPRVKNSTCF
jgi:hypothetical protein